MDYKTKSNARKNKTVEELVSLIKEYPIVIQRAASSIAKK